MKPTEIVKGKEYNQGFIDGQNDIICSETIQKEIEDKCLKSFEAGKKDVEIENFETMIQILESEYKFIQELDNELLPEGILNDLCTPDWREINARLKNRLTLIEFEITQIKDILKRSS